VKTLRYNVATTASDTQSTIGSGRGGVDDDDDDTMMMTLIIMIIMMMMMMKHVVNTWKPRANTQPAYTLPLTCTSPLLLLMTTTMS
jgi:hypothetical protein